MAAAAAAPQRPQAAHKTMAATVDFLAAAAAGMQAQYPLVLVLAQADW